MTPRHIYIKSATQISMQQPLSEAWLSSPEMPAGPYVRSIDPDFRQWFTPLQSRRMGKLLKRALATALTAIERSAISQPDAIITGTGIGCIESTEQFLNQLCRDGETLLQPTSFMQSTHNTVSSLIAIHTRQHGYNTTYSHKAVSFDMALLDAFTQLRLGDISSALVTGNDELSPSYFRILQRAGFVGQPGQVAAGEVSMAMMLTTDPADTLCEVESVSMSCRQLQSLSLPPVAGVDMLVVGTNGLPANDAPYRHVASLYPGVARLAYKQLFGESYSASAVGVYAAAHLLHSRRAGRVLFVNHSDDRNASLVVLKSVQQP